MTHQVKIILADDHTLITQALTVIIDGMPGFKVIATVKSYPQLYEALQDYDADILLLDAIILDGTINDNLPLIRTHFPKLKVILVWLGANENTLLSWVHLLNR